MNPIDLPNGYYMRQLALADVVHVVDLQTVVIRHLPPERFHDISHRSADDFQKRMTDLGRMFGIFTHTHQLVAYSTLALANDAWPVCDMALHPSDAPCLPHELAVSQNSVVHPEHRGKSFHRIMLETKIHLCQHFSRRHVMAQLVNHNIESLSNLIKVGFHVVQASITPIHKCNGLKMHLDLLGAPLESESLCFVDAVKDFDYLKALLEEGYKGVGIKKSSKCMHGWLLKMVKPSL